MGLGRDVAQHRGPARRHGRHDGILRAGDARLVEEHISTLQSLGRELDAVGELMRRTELFEGEKVSVEPTASDDVATRG